MKKYDFIVVGSGCAGLAASLELLTKGRKVLMIEQHNIPGGAASGFVRGRFEFEPSLHELCSVGTPENPGDVLKMMDRFGVKVKWNQVKDCFRIISVYSDGSPMDVTLPAGKDAFIEKLNYYVPGCKDSIENMFALFDEVRRGLDYAGGDSYSVAVLMLKYLNLLKVGAQDCLTVFKALGMPQKAIDIISTYWSYLGVDMAHLSFPHYASMVSSYVTLGAAIPSHTSHEISVAMVERIRELGGDVIFNCRAEEFIFEDGKCKGVKTNLGEFRADCVLANINPDLIYGNMMDKSLVPEREKKLSAARNRNMSARMFTTYIGLNKSAEELGIKDYSIFISGTSDSVKEYESLKKIDTNNYEIFLCYNVDNPEASPEGTCICSFTTFYADGEEWSNVTDEEYYKLKTKIAKHFLDTLKEKTGLDLAPYIEEISIATPWTFARYLNTPEGCVYGYEASDWDNIIARSMSLKSDYADYDLGLLPIGAAGPRGDGYSSAYITGMIVAGIADKKYGKGGNN